MANTRLLRGLEHTLGVCAMNATKTLTLRSENSESVRPPKHIGFGPATEVESAHDGNEITIHAKRPRVAQTIKILAALPRLNRKLIARKRSNMICKIDGVAVRQQYHGPPGRRRSSNYAAFGEVLPPIAISDVCGVDLENGVYRALDRRNTQRVRLRRI